MVEKKHLDTHARLQWLKNGGMQDPVGSADKSQDSFGIFTSLQP